MKNQADFPQVFAAGEQSVVVVFGGKISPEILARVLGLAAWLRENPFPGLVECVPANASLTVFFDPFLVRLAWPEKPSPSRAVAAFLFEKLPMVPPFEIDNEEVVEIPVQYGGAFGPDLGEVSGRLGLAENDVVRLHTGAVYTVFMVGFLPGFPYLGPLAEALVLPRKTTPVLRVAAGSVAIAGRQTGIYPQQSPGGWHVIGRTEFRLFDAGKNPPAFFRAGQRVRFLEI